MHNLRWPGQEKDTEGCNNAGLGHSGGSRPLLQHFRAVAKDLGFALVAGLRLAVSRQRNNTRQLVPATYLLTTVWVQ